MTNFITSLITIYILSHSSFLLAIEATKASVVPTINGINDDPSWQHGKWYELDQLISGQQASKHDFSGRFKVAWDENKLYLLVEITDDVLFDQHANPLFRYWDDDCLEIFIDEDASGGNHQYNFNAFAYHIALDNQTVDIGYQNQDGSPQFLTLNNHIHSQWKRSKISPNNLTWELAIDIYNDKFSYVNQNNTNVFKGKPIKLHLGKKIGFMLAYCDNDGSKERESFYGSAVIKPVNGDKNLGYITADVFEELILVK